MTPLYTSSAVRKAILLMGGAGTRFGSSLPKQFHRLAGKKIYLYTLEALLNSRLFHEIILVTHAHWQGEVEKDLVVYQPSRCRVVEGGVTRQESSFLGLIACGPETEIVLIHDAVRPFIAERILRENVEKAQVIGAVDTCIPSTDTLVFAPDKKQISTIPERSELFRGQTPQTFRYSLILQAHQVAKEKNLTAVSDDCRLVCEMGTPVAIVEGGEENIKITTELDLVMAQQMLALGYGPTSFDISSYTLQDRLFVVTGAQGGIGSVLCQLLEKEGARVVRVARKQATYCVDLESEEEIIQCFTQIYQEYGPIDGLLNCAGVLSKKTLLEQTLEEIDSVLDVNLRAVILTCKYAVIKEGGHIVNIASSSYTKGRKEMAVYAATKAAVVNFTQGLAEERPDLFVDVISPERTNTPMRRAHFPDEREETLLHPKKVANAIVDLLKRKRHSHAALPIRKK